MGKIKRHENEAIMSRDTQLSILDPETVDLDQIYDLYG